MADKLEEKEEKTWQEEMEETRQMSRQTVNSNSKCI